MYPKVQRKDFIAAIEAGIVNCAALTPDDVDKLRAYAQTATQSCVGTFEGCPLSATGIFNPARSNAHLFSFTRNYDRMIDRIARVPGELIQVVD